jgi:hypothetical protein|tara:strand:+ start:985 stop:1116 length:132 start_codon:yes stop_codon:yes gene_type:complete
MTNPREKEIEIKKGPNTAEATLGPALEIILFAAAYSYVKVCFS